MVEQQRDMRIPSELIPRCPHCGREMSMNLRSDNTFVQDEGWYAAQARYAEFKRRHKAVSYTHLDVYKRQLLVLRCGFPSLERLAGLFGFPSAREPFRLPIP